MKFSKMQGCGNDYVYVNGFTEKVEESKKPELVRWLSNRNFGIGSDGVIFILPSKEADFEMEMFNADGTRSEMCGNGIRCVAKFVYDKGLTDQTQISVISGGVVKLLTLTVEEGLVSRVRVNMGRPVWAAKEVPVVSEHEEVIGEVITVAGKAYEMTCVSMGNPHAVVFVDEVEGLALHKIGPLFEMHERFPRRVNTEFVKVIDERTVQMRVWERGTGETLACGTGACAVAVAAMRIGLTEDEVTVKLPGGDLLIAWDRKEDTVYMTGPAVTVFEGEIDIVP